MILIDALYVNNGGGKRLLNLFVKELSKNNNNVFYLFDSRVNGDFNFLDKNKVAYVNASLFKRHIFYLKNKNKFTCVFSFGNIPPTISLKIPVYTYFHNYTFLMNGIYGFSLLKSLIIRLLNRNTSYWVVQSNLVKEKLAESWSIDKDKVLVLPFFEDIINIYKNKTNVKYDSSAINFVYISDGHNYKNHKNLIIAFVKYSKSYPNSTLTLTIGHNYVDLINNINNARKKGAMIYNKGLISYSDVVTQLINSDVVVYPSTVESFGLGLIEAAQLGLPICAANLPYVFEVVIPNCTFDPLSTDSIYQSLINSHKILGHSSELVCKSKLINLIKIITNA
jgi:glycosyltransferase involved in cell wall biosynthesis